MSMNVYINPEAIEDKSISIKKLNMRRRIFNASERQVILNAENCNGVIDLGDLNVKEGTVNYTLDYDGMEIGVPYIIKFKVPAENMQETDFMMDSVISFNNNADNNIKWAFGASQLWPLDEYSDCYFEINFVRYESSGPIFGVWAEYK